MHRIAPAEVLLVVISFPFVRVVVDSNGLVRCPAQVHVMREGEVREPKLCRDLRQKESEIGFRLYGAKVIDECNNPLEPHELLRSARSRGTPQARLIHAPPS
jgi:hypothetical protein